MRKPPGAPRYKCFRRIRAAIGRAAIDVPALEAFARMRRDAGIDPCAIHTPYLINLASEDPKIYHGSLRLLRNDLAVAARGGIRCVNTHLGSYGVRERNEGFSRRFAGALEAALDGIEPDVFLVLRELRGCRQPRGQERSTSSGASSTRSAIPSRRLSRHGARVGGRLRNRSESGGRSIHRSCGRTYRAGPRDDVHFNDTEVPLGASRDRHWHIGEGKNCGIGGFRASLAHPELRAKTAILETPGDDADDVRNVRTILSLERAVASPS